MDKPTLLLSAPVATRSGYGEHARDIFKSLLEMDRFDIKIFSQRWGNTPMNALYPNNPLHQEILKRIIPITPKIDAQPDVWIQITVPDEFQKVGKYNIGITAGIESTVCSPEWITGLNNMDLIIVPSKFSKEVFEKTVYDSVDPNTQVKTGVHKCNTPIEVIFEGVDLSIYEEKGNDCATLRREMNIITEDFAFLFVGHWLKGDIGHDRKDVGMLIKVFLETFKKEVNPPALVLKTSSATFSIIDKKGIQNKIRHIKKSVVPDGDKKLPNVYLIHGELTPEEMSSLYNHNKVKAHVSFTKGEGFGRPLLEASLSGKPIIASNWSGHVDFLHPNYNLLIGGKLENIHESAAWENVLIKESKWFYIDYNQAANTMYSVYKNYKGAKDMCSPQKEYAKKFSLIKMHQLVKEVFDKYVPEFPTTVKLKLPTLKKIEL